MFVAWPRLLRAQRLSVHAPPLDRPARVRRGRSGRPSRHLPHLGGAVVAVRPRPRPRGHRGRRQRLVVRPPQDARWRLAPADQAHQQAAPFPSPAERGGGQEGHGRDSVCRENKRERKNNELDRKTDLHAWCRFSKCATWAPSSVT